MLQTFDRIGPFIVVLSQSEAIPARKRRVVVRCVVCERVSEMNERSLLDKRTEGQRACAKCRVYTTNGTWTKGWRAKMENAAIEANRLNKENADLRDEIDKVLRERDEARAEIARLRRLLNMAEDELIAADDHGRREAKRADTIEAEVEALKAERDEARAEVERLRAEAAPMNEHFTAGYRDGYRDAYRRGAEAMREACAQWFREHDESFELTVDACHDVIADMPIPEEP